MRFHKLLRTALVGLVLAAGAAQAQTAVKPGFNLFSAKQDVEIGKQSAAQVNRQLPMIHNSSVTSYVSRLGARLAKNAPGAKFPYQFRVVNLSDVNAFALPGGYIYLHRGLIERTRTEGELAGVMAHEIAHIALRHQTHQVSKAYVAQTGIGLLGGIIGDKRKSSSVVKAVGGFGLNALFLRFSRSAEQQADVVGAQIMARSGYDPMDMARFFDVLRREAGGNPSKLGVFFSDHPAPADRAARVRREANLLKVRETSPVGGLSTARAALRRMPPAPTRSQLISSSGAPALPQAAFAPPHVRAHEP